MLIITNVAECLAKKFSGKGMWLVAIILKNNVARSGKIVEITQLSNEWAHFLSMYLQETLTQVHYEISTKIFY